MVKNSLIILNYNDYKTTVALVEVVEKYKNIDKIIIVDNHSSDNSKNMLKKLVSEKIDFIETEKNKGYAYGNNFGIKYAINKYKTENVIIANPDIHITEETLSEILDYINKNSQVAIATATMKNLHRGEYKVSKLRAWKEPSYLYCVLSAMFLTSKFADKLIKYNDEKFKEKISEVHAVQGSFFVAKANILKEVGFLEERTFLYCEEMILANKIKKQGYKEVIFNSLYYNHDHAVTINKNIKNKVNKYKILNESLELYLREYLKVSNFKLKLFNYCCRIGIFERKIIYFIIDKLKKQT